MHARVMSAPQKRALKMIGAAASHHGFVLAGGTAVALHLGHRRSIIYALMREFRPLPELVTLYQLKFSLRDPGHLLFALAFFDDAEEEPMPDMLWPVKWGEIKKTIRAALKGMS